MAIEVKLPNLGEEIESAQVIEVLVTEGETVKAEQDILEIETDKATVSVPSSDAGSVQKIHVSSGDEVKPGDVLLTLEGSEPTEQPESTEEKSEEKQPPESEEPQQDETQEQQAASPGPDEEEQAREEQPQEVRDVGQGRVAQIPAAPAVRRLARELGVDLEDLSGSGPDGRILKEDVHEAIRRKQDSLTKEKKQKTDPAEKAEDRDAWGPIRRQSVNKVRATIASRMSESASKIPHVTHFDQADITDLDEFRQERKDDLAPEGVKLTIMPFVVKAVVDALAQHPKLNATFDFDAGEVLYKQYVSIGIAIDTERGLVVPVLRNVEELSIARIARSLSELAENTRNGDYSVEDLRGGTFTISNQGAIGGQYATPIINYPESAILLLGRAQKQPCVVDGSIQSRLILPLSLSYDHRLIDGADAGRFVNTVKDLLQYPGKLLLTL